MIPISRVNTDPAYLPRSPYYLLWRVGVDDVDGYAGPIGSFEAAFAMRAAWTEVHDGDDDTPAWRNVIVDAHGTVIDGHLTVNGQEMLAIIPDVVGRLFANDFAKLTFARYRDVANRRHVEMMWEGS